MRLILQCVLCGGKYGIVLFFNGSRFLTTTRLKRSSRISSTLIVAWRTERTETHSLCGYWLMIVCRGKGVRAISGAGRHSLQNMISTILHNRSKEVAVIVTWEMTFSDRINLSDDKCKCEQYQNCPCVDATSCLKYERRIKKFEDNKELGELFFYIYSSYS